MQSLTRFGVPNLDWNSQDPTVLAYTRYYVNEKLKAAVPRHNNVYDYLQLRKTCVYCGEDYNVRDNIGTWRCKRHPGKYIGHWSCCDRPKYEDYPCTMAQHNDKICIGSAFYLDEIFEFIPDYLIAGDDPLVKPVSATWVFDEQKLNADLDPSDCLLHFSTMQELEEVISVLLPPAGKKSPLYQADDRRIVNFSEVQNLCEIDAVLSENTQISDTHSDPLALYNSAYGTNDFSSTLSSGFKFVANNHPRVVTGPIRNVQFSNFIASSPLMVQQDDLKKLDEDARMDNLESATHFFSNNYAFGQNLRPEVNATGFQPCVVTYKICPALDTDIDAAFDHS